MGTAASTCHCGREPETICLERIDAQTLLVGGLELFYFPYIGNNHPH